MKSGLALSSCARWGLVFYVPLAIAIMLQRTPEQSSALLWMILSFGALVGVGLCLRKRIDGSFAEQWQHFRRVRAQFLGFWYGGALLSITVGLLLHWPGRASVWRPILGVVAAALMLLTSVRLFEFKCPRCRKPFVRAFWRTTPWRGTCVHCGLEVGGDNARPG